MRRLFLCLLAAASLPALALAPAQPEGASGLRPVQDAAGRLYLAVTANGHATAAAVEILELGGSAADAAIAAQLVLNVVEPQSSGIGGGGFLLHWDARRREVLAYDGRETAPRLATADFALDANGRPLRFDQMVATGKSVGTPGLVAMLEMAHRAHGRLRWDRLFRPAIRLARDGFAVSPRLHGLLAEDQFLHQDGPARALYYPDGKPLPAGAWLVNPALAANLEAIAREGSPAFYQGPLAAAMAAAVQARGGWLSTADLASYSPQRREAVCAPFLRWRVCGMPPPSSGGIAIGQLLGLLARVAPQPGPIAGADAAHLFAEAGRLVFADRAHYLADPDFVEVPGAALLAPAYLDQRAALIRPDGAMSGARPGQPVAGLARAVDDAPELPATTHLSIVDAEGNAVALTSSIESGFGSRILVGGFLMNNQVTDFAFVPIRDGVPVANRLEPGKRPLSSMAPTLVFDERGDLQAVAGSPGGPRIIGYTARALWAMLVGDASPAEAVALPHVGNRNGATELEAGTAAEEIAAELVRRGHEVRRVPMTSGLHVIRRVGGAWIGAADPRREGSALGR